MNKRRMVVIAQEKMAWHTFCKVKTFAGILSFDSIVSDCKIVEIPPKLMTNDARIVARRVLAIVARSMQPFVISMQPSKRKRMFSGRNDKSGEKHSMTIKKIVMMHPTERIARVELRTMSERSVWFLGESEV